jgi:hypothetical protein
MHQELNLIDAYTHRILSHTQLAIGLSAKRLKQNSNAFASAIAQ